MKKGKQWTKNLRVGGPNLMYLYQSLRNLKSRGEGIGQGNVSTFKSVLQVGVVKTGRGEDD